MTVHLLGVERSSVLSSGILAIWRDDWVILALLLGIFGIVLPFVRFGALMVVLAAVSIDRPFAGIGSLFRWTTQLDVWTMPDVYLVGCFVGYARITQELTTTIGPGGYCFIVAALMSMLTRASLDRRTVWRAIAPEQQNAGEPALSCPVCDLVVPISQEGQPCPRCGLKLRARKRDAVVRAAALSYGTRGNDHERRAFSSHTGAGAAQRVAGLDLGRANRGNRRDRLARHSCAGARRPNRHGDVR